MRPSRSATRFSTGWDASLYTGVAEPARSARTPATRSEPRTAAASRLRIREAEAEREQRVVVRVADVDRHLVDTARPGGRELPDGSAVAEEDVRDAGAFRPREPGGDER